METITLKVDNDIFDKFQWLMGHFAKNEINIVNDIDYISVEKMNDLNEISNNYKKGDKSDFEEYVI